MSAGRPFAIQLLDGSTVNIIVQPKLLGSELFDLVTSQHRMREKAYFGLSWRDPDSKGLESWLDLEQPVLDQGLPKLSPVHLAFGVRFFVDDVATLVEFTTQKMFFLQALRLVTNGSLLCPVDDAITLAALALQALQGDFLSDSATRHHLDRTNLVSNAVIVAFSSSLESVAASVGDVYKTLIGTSEPSAVLSYVTIAQRLPKYGSHYYDVKSTTGELWKLGVSPAGLALYTFHNTATPRKMYTWDELSNVSFNKTKFSMEMIVTAAKAGAAATATGTSIRRQMQSPKGTEKSTLVTTVWTTASAMHSLQIIGMVIGQHRFFIDSELARRARAAQDTSPSVTRRFGRESLMLGGQRESPTEMRRVLPGQRTVLLPPTAHPALLARLGLSPRDDGVGPAGPVGSPASNGARGEAPLPPRLSLADGPVGAPEAESFTSELLDKLERRKDQLEAELRRKRALMAKFEAEEEIFRAVARGEALAREATPSALPAAGDELPSPPPPAEAAAAAGSAEEDEEVWDVPMPRPPRLSIPPPPPSPPSPPLPPSPPPITASVAGSPLLPVAAVASSPDISASSLDISGKSVAVLPQQLPTASDVTLPLAETVLYTTVAHDQDSGVLHGVRDSETIYADVVVRPALPICVEAPF